MDDRAYAYLIGVYLGDGWSGALGRTWALRVTLDAAYHRILRECAVAMAAVHPSRVTWHIRHGGTMVVLQSCGAAGRKHERRIELKRWQCKITHRHTKEFIRGLIHSDGSRCINRFSVKLPSGRIGHYAYPRYFFTNYSADIRRIFVEHCQLLGIRCTRSNRRNISISHRESVA